MRSTFSVHFYLKKQEMQNGKAPIYARITVDGKPKTFSTAKGRYYYFLPIRRNKASFNLSRNGVGIFRIFNSPKLRDRLLSN